MTALTITLSVVILILLYAIRNLIIKVEKYEDATEIQTAYLQSISDTVKSTREQLEEKDMYKYFQGEDEVGAFFEEIKKIQELLNNYIVDVENGEKEEQQ